MVGIYFFLHVVIVLVLVVVVHKHSRVNLVVHWRLLVQIYVLPGHNFFVISVLLLNF